MHSYRADEPTRRNELVPEAEEGPGEAQVNFADAVERPNPTPEASETNSVQEGKPRSMSYLL